MPAIRFVAEEVGVHVVARFWAGPDSEHLASAGLLILRPDAWAYLKSLLLGDQKPGFIEASMHQDECTLDTTRGFRLLPRKED